MVDFVFEIIRFDSGCITLSSEATAKEERSGKSKPLDGKMAGVNEVL